MTSNQINYQANKEKERSNRAQERIKRDELEHSKDVLSETKRSNIAREKETNRSNVAKEVETNRSNVASENLKYMSNIITADHYYTSDTLQALRDKEVARHNTAQETETHRSNVATETAAGAKIAEEVRKNTIQAVSKFNEGLGAALAYATGSQTDISSLGTSIMRTLGIGQPKLYYDASHKAGSFNNSTVVPELSHYGSE